MKWVVPHYHTNTAITDYDNYWQKEEHKIIFVEQMITETEARLYCRLMDGQETQSPHQQSKD